MAKIEYIWHDRRRRFGMPLSFTRYALSEDRLFLETGFFNAKCDEILLYRVRDISLTITLWQRIFGVGTITVSSSDKTLSTLVIKNIRHPRDIKELIHQSVEEMKLSRRIRIGEILGGVDEDMNDDDYD